MTLFYASVSIITASVLGLVIGAVVGIRFWIRFIKSMDKALSLEKHKNTAGAMWLAHSVREKIRDGATTAELTKWLDAKADEMTVVVEGRELFGRDGE